MSTGGATGCQWDGEPTVIARIDMWLSGPRDAGEAARLLEEARAALAEARDSLDAIRRGCAAAADIVGGRGALSVLAAAQDGLRRRGRSCREVRCSGDADADRAMAEVAALLGKGHDVRITRGGG